MTRSAIVTDLKNMIGPSSEVSDAGLAVWVDDAYGQIIDEIIKVNPDYFTKGSTSSTINGQQEYSLPSDFEKMVMVNLQIDGTWKRVMPMGNADIRFIPRNADTSSNQGFSTAEPQYYIYGNSTIGFMPIPDETTSNNIKIWYQYTPSLLTADSSTPDIPDRYHHIIKFGAYANYLDQDDEHVAAERMRQRFDEKIRKMIENMMDRQVDEVKSVEIVQNRDMYVDDVAQI